MVSSRSLLAFALHVALLATPFSAWLRNSVLFDPDGLNYYKEGKSDAIADLRNGRLRIKDNEPDTLKDRIYKEDLQKNHGIVRDTLNLGQIHVQLTDYIRGYNEVMEPAIRDYMGPTKLDQLERQVGDELERRTETAEDGVYSAVLGEIEQDNAMILVVGDKTWDRLSNLDPEIRSRFALETIVEDWNMPPLSPLTQSRREAVEDYKTKNEKPVELKAKFEVKSECLLLNEGAFYAFFSAPPVYESPMDGWRNYYKKYPTSPGYIRLSRIGFNSDMTEALVYVERKCGSLCADGRFKVVAKEGSRWEIKTSIPFFAS